MKKINLYFLTFIFLFFANPSLSIDQEIKDIVDTIDAAKNDFNDVDTSEVIEAVKIDKAFEQIDKVTEFVKEALQDGNEDSAIKALEFIEKSLAGTNALVPQEFSSDMSKADIGSFGEDKMAIVNEITADMKVIKEEKLNDLVSGMVDISEEGIDSFGIVETLDKIGIETIDVAIAISKKKEMATWTKEEWAESWNGDVLTDDGKQIISDDEINSNLSTLEQKLQVNNLDILDKKSSLTELQTKIDPLSGQIIDLKTQKTELLAKYNEEILKQSSTILSDEEINKSKGLADDFNNQLSNLTNQIMTAEEQSNSLQQQVQGINLELANEIATKSQLEKNISTLNNQLKASQNLLTKKQLELDQLKSSAPNLNKNLNELNSQLEDASLQKDFVQVQFERSIDKEVEAFNHYAEILWDGPSSTSKQQEVDFAMREVSTMLDNDPKKQRIFEIEKYGIYAGLSDAEINKGINAIQNDDWEAQKEVTKNIYKGLNKSSEWNVSVPSNAEINVIIAEEKAIQEASILSTQLQEIKSTWDKKINEQVKDIQPLASLSLLTVKSAATWEGMKEHSFLVEETNKLLVGSDLETLNKNYQQAQNAYDEYMNKDWRSVNYKGYDLNKATKLQLEKNKFYYAAKEIEWDAERQARENLYKKVEEAQKQFNQITSQENPEYKEVKNKITNILKKVPTFDDGADLVADLDPAMMRAKLYDIVDGTTDVQALEALRTAMSEIGDKPVSEFMTGPYWEMSNVKAAAILKSKKYSWIDDYAIYNHYEPLNLKQSDLELAENQLSNVLKTANPKLDALNDKISKLSKELEVTKNQSLTINEDINNLESELTSLKSSESEIQNQISDLSNQFSSKENLITEKTQNLASLQEQLNPLSDKMSELEGQREDLDAKLNTQLTTISNQIESQGQATDEANVLKAQFESQIAQLDSQLKNYEKQSTEINSQLTSLTTELTILETETPEISGQISKLNNELKNVIEIKADLAMTQAIKSGINVNEKIVASVAKLENKSIVQIEGTNLMRVVDTDTLTNEAGNFEAPVGTFTKGNQVYLAGAVTREQILSVGKIDETGDLNIQLSQVAAEKINSGMFGLDTAKGLVATDTMAEGTYSLIDPKTGRQVLDSHTGNALYGGIICDGDQCGPSGDLGKKVAASGYAFVRTGDINQGGMCSDGNCAFNISSSELQTFNKQIADGVESPFGYDDALAAATINTKGLVADTVSEAAGTVTKEFFSGKFNIMEDGGAEALLQKAKDAVTRLETAKASGQQIDENVLASAKSQVAAEQSVVDAVKAAKAAATSTTQVASAATEAASAASEAASEAAKEVTQVVQAAAHEVIDGVRAQKNVVQLVQNSDGSVHVIVGKTGVNVTGSQTVIYTGLTDAAANQGSACSSGNAAGCADHKKAVAEAEAASGVKVTGNPEGY